ncbi:hypothetical protein M405DRAFT_869363 [Rhizopogon salebrosus TDB-379]|nr:hypothetical protein M405DRAFT_869363 [Rhizopogon salebrosus TDB-379]
MDRSSTSAAAASSTLKFVYTNPASFGASHMRKQPVDHVSSPKAAVKKRKLSGIPLDSDKPSPRLSECSRDEVREINALLVVTSERLETESNRANTSERHALEYFNRLRQATEGRDRATQEAARLHEELKLYKLQLDNA